MDSIRNLPHCATPGRNGNSELLVAKGDILNHGQRHRYLEGKTWGGSMLQCLRSGIHHPPSTTSFDKEIVAKLAVTTINKYQSCES